MGSNRPLDPTEDYARLLIHQATARILENTGFAQSGERALATLSDITRKLLQKMWVDAKAFAEHAGRRQPNFSDANMVFKKLHFSPTELRDYMQQTQPIPFERKPPMFPAGLKTDASIYGPVSERELDERSESIPRYFPAVHPEWCAGHVSSAVPNYPPDIDRPCSSVMHQPTSSNDRRGTRAPKCRVPFPDFTGLTAKDLGLVRQKRAAIFVPTKGPEPSGISSSANISAAQAAASATASMITTKLKHRKVNALEKVPAKVAPPVTGEPSTSNASNVESFRESSLVKSEVDDKTSESHPVRPSGMFGMPPSAAVHSDGVADEALKAKKKKSKKEHDKERSKEKKEKHKNKEKHKEKKKHSGEREGLSVSSNDLHLHDGVSLSALGASTSCWLDAATIPKSELVTLEAPRIEHKPCLIPMLFGSSPSPADAPVVRQEMPHKPPILNEEPVKETARKERKNNKRERAKPRIKSVEIVPSDDSDSDSQAGTSAPTSDKKVDVGGTKESEKEKGKGIAKEKEKKSKPEDGKQRSSRCVSLKDVETRAEQADGRDWVGEKERDSKQTSQNERVAQGQLELRLEREDVGLLKLKWESLDDVHPTMAPPLAMTVAQHDEAPKITMILSRSDMQKDFSAFSPSGMLCPPEGTYAPTSDSADQLQFRSAKETAVGGMTTKPAPELPRETYLTAERSEVTDMKDKKKKRRKEKDREKSHEHVHKHKDKKKDKEHRKEKRKEKSEREAHSSEGKYNKKRRIEETEIIDGQPLPKVPKLKIIIGGGASSVQASPSSTCSPLASPVMNEQLKLKVKPVASQDCSSGYDSQSLSPGAPKTSAQQLKQFTTGDVNSKSADSTHLIEPGGASYSDNKKAEEKMEQKRPPCVTKAELKAMSSPPKKKRINPLLAMARKQEWKSDEDPSNKERNHKNRDREKVDREKEREKDKERERERERQREKEKEREQREKEKEREKEAEREREREREKERERDREREGERERIREREREREERSREKDRELEREKEKEREKVKEMETREKQREERERQRIEKSRQKEEKEKQRDDRERTKEEKERQKGMKEKSKEDREKQKEKGKEKGPEKDRKKNSKPLSSKDIKPPSSKDVKPPSNRDVKPPQGKEVKPSSGRDIKPPSGKEVKPASGKDVKPPSGKDVTTSASSGLLKKEKETEMVATKVDRFSNEWSKGSTKKRKEKQCIAVENDDSPDKDVWICPECSVAYVDGATDMVGCDACDNWFHWSCVGLLVAPPVDVPWYCQSCAKKNAKRGSSSSKGAPGGKKPRK